MNIDLLIFKFKMISLCYKMKKRLYILLITASFLACTSENKTPKKKSKPSNEAKIVSAAANTVKTDSVVVADYLPEDLLVYSLGFYEISKNERVAFVSFSDNYALSEHPDSSAIPSLENMKEEDAGRLYLKGRYRKRFLTQMGLSESDSVFIYDYAKNKLSSVVIKSLRLVANITGYDPEWPYSQGEYYIGFEINEKKLKKSDYYYSFCLVFAGKRNPFVLGEMKPVMWQKMAAKNFPSNPINKEDKTQISKSKKGKAYSYKTDEMEYFLQEFVKEESVFALRLVVIKNQNKEILCDKFYYEEEEGTSFLPIGFNKDVPDYNQWTGKLFSNKAPVILGLEYGSFGCPSITVLDPKGKDIYINCDNRH